ncbi:MAG TPA: P-loop NTPase [Actinomycetota bacterium]|nr:P-loop NTPase [Actinomycetota bacterium]
MPTTEQVRDVLATINDPELHRGIVELGMVKGIDIKGSRVTVDLALTIPGCPLKSFFLEVLPARIKEEFSDISDVQVNLGAMTEEERKALVGGVRAGGAQEELTPFAGPDSPTIVIAIGSGKGGVGKSTTTVNLAAGLVQQGHSVGLIDADMYGYSIPRMLGVTTRPTMVDEHLIIPPEAYGFKLMSIGSAVPDEETPFISRGPMLGKYLHAFLTQVHWQDPEYLLLDLPPGTGDVAMDIGQRFLPGSSMILVTTPQKASTNVAARAGLTAQKLGMHVAGVIENMAYAICDHCGERTYPFGSGGGKELSEKFDVPLLGQIPLDPPMRDFADHGKPAVVELPDSVSAIAFKETVQRIEKLFPPRPKRSVRKTLPLIMTPAKPHTHGPNGHTH